MGEQHRLITFGGDWEHLGVVTSQGGSVLGVAMSRDNRLNY